MKTVFISLHFMLIASPIFGSNKKNAVACSQCLKEKENSNEECYSMLLKSFGYGSNRHKSEQPAMIGATRKTCFNPILKLNDF